MKKKIFLLTAFIITMSMNAQIIKVYKNGNTKPVKTYIDSKDTKHKAVFTEITSGVPSDAYVEIAAKYDGTNVTTLKWAKQNLAITPSGNKAWKGNNSNSAVKIPGTDEDIIIGDYFQWAVYEGFAGNATDSDKGLIQYTSFTNQYCVGDNTNVITLKNQNKQFIITNAPYHDTQNTTSKYNKYFDNTKTVLDLEDDAANIILGGNWRIPSLQEFTAMKEATKWTYDTTDKGYYVTPLNESLNADKSNALLFFPNTGQITGSEFGNPYNGMYWLNSVFTNGFNGGLRFYTDAANYVYFGTNASFQRYSGLNIRPVSE